MVGKGYQHSPRLYLNVLGSLPRAPAELIGHLSRLHATQAAGVGGCATTQGVLVQESWAAALRAGAEMVRGRHVGARDVVSLQPVGLHNLGNTCFANAWLQVLFMTVSFRARLVRAPLSTGAAGSRPVVALALQRLLAGLMLSPRRGLDATSFLAAMPKWECVEGWRARAQQQDSAEFGQLLLDRVEGETKGIRGAPRLVSGVFGGVVASAVRCGTCGACSTQREEMEAFCISLDLPARDVGAKPPAAPHVCSCQLLTQHFAAEDLEASSSISDTGERVSVPIYNCDHCAGLVPATKTTVVMEPPRHMLVTLKRFTFDGRATKLTGRVGLSLWIWLPDIPAHLEPHCDNAGQGRGGSGEAASGADAIPEGVADQRVGAASANRMYALYAVVVHSGTSANSGHYFSYARHLGAATLAACDPASPVAHLAAVLWSHGRALAEMPRSDRNGDAGRQVAREAAKTLQEGIRLAPQEGGSPLALAIRQRLQSELDRLGVVAKASQHPAPSGSGSPPPANGDQQEPGEMILDALHAAGNLLAQYAEAVAEGPVPGWWLFNDATVSPLAGGFGAIESLGASNAHETPYILLYKRCDVSPEVGDEMGVEDVPPSLRYAVYCDELDLLRRGTEAAPRVRSGGGGGAPSSRLPHQFGPAGGAAGGGMGGMPRWGM